jgi:predicted dehydrogenase
MCLQADAKGLPLMTVANKRFSPPYRKAKRLITEGPVSDPAMFVGKFNLGYDYVDLFESGTVHLFDIARYLMGDAAKIRCIGLDKYKRCRRKFPVDNAVAQLELKSGAVGAVYTSSSALSFKPWERVEVYANHAWLDVDDQYKLTLHDSETEGSRSWTPIVPNTLFFDEEFGGFTGLIENFAQAIRGAAKPEVDAWDGYRAYEMLVACELSLSRGGEAIELPLDPARADEEAHAWLKAAGWPGDK